MTVKLSRPGGRRPGGQRPSGQEPTAKKSVGRPKGETLVAQMDRYLDRLESQTGLKANRGMIARRALALFLASHVTEHAPDREG